MSTASPALSRREREVAALVAEGLSNREIAERLFISERTAEGHREQIRNKLWIQVSGADCRLGCRRLHPVGTGCSSAALHSHHPAQGRLRD